MNMEKKWYSVYYEKAQKNPDVNKSAPIMVPRFVDKRGKDTPFPYHLMNLDDALESVECVLRYRFSYGDKLIIREERE
jgi:hypothetical protein